MLVVLKTVTFLAAVFGSKGIDFTEHVNRSQALISNLRRQLMNDNYDYSFEENKNNITKEIKTTTIINSVRKNFYISGPKKGEDKSNVSYDSDHEEDTKIDPVLKKDFSVNTDNLKQKKVTKPTAKYKILKVKHQYRRKNPPRLIQEENKDGIAIVNLDEGPIPELQLPKTRRQYMHHLGELIADEKEVPPPPINSSDPEAAVENDEEK